MSQIPANYGTLSTMPLALIGGSTAWWKQGQKTGEKPSIVKPMVIMVGVGIGIVGLLIFVMGRKRK